MLACCVNIQFQRKPVTVFKYPRAVTRLEVVSEIISAKGATSYCFLRGV